MNLKNVESHRNTTRTRRKLNEDIIICRTYVCIIEQCLRFGTERQITLHDKTENSHKLALNL